MSSRGIARARTILAPRTDMPTTSNAAWRSHLIESTDEMRALLKRSRRIAVLGIKPESRADQPAHFVAEYAKDAHLYSKSRVLRSRRIMRMGLPEGYRVAAREDVGKAPSSSRILAGEAEARVTPAQTKESEPQSPVIPDAAR